MDILIVEDEEPLRASMIDGLAAAFSDVRVHGVSSVEEAESLLEKKPSPRLIISDIRLPGKDGVELLISARKNGTSIPFIFMSAFPSVEAREEASSRGLKFLSKPFEFTELVAAVESVLEAEEFTGNLGGIALVDLLQVLNMGRRTAMVTVARRSEAGKIFFVDGEVVHAEAGDRVGREAFDYLIGWKGGSFGSEPGCKPPTTTIDQPFNSILLDAFRVQDEDGTGDDDLAGFSDAFDALHQTGEGKTIEAIDETQPLSSSLVVLVDLLPDCVAAAIVDVTDEVVLDMTPAEVVPESVAKLLPPTTAQLFSDGALSKLDRSLTAGPSQVREIIMVSSDLIHFFQRSRAHPEQVVVAVCSASSNLGTVVTKARTWLRGSD